MSTAWGLGDIETCLLEMQGTADLLVRLSASEVQPNPAELRHCAADEPSHTRGLRDARSVRPAVQLRGGGTRIARNHAEGLTMSGSTKKLGFIASAVCVAIVAAAGAASAQQQNPPQQPGQTAMVVETPSGPATCATWIQFRSPGAHPVDTAAIEYWSDGYLSGLAAGSHHDLIGQFRREDLVAWLTRYCAANPRTRLPLAIHALGHAMLAHPGGPLS
jgi:hypothetical protein